MLYEDVVFATNGRGNVSLLQQVQSMGVGPLSMLDAQTHERFFNASKSQGVTQQQLYRSQILRGNIPMAVYNCHCNLSAFPRKGRRR